MNAQRVVDANIVPAFEPKAPDLILAEVWATKRRINAEAGYDIKKLIEMATSPEAFAMAQQIRVKNT